jgi:hypothetical protein
VIAIPSPASPTLSRPANSRRYPWYDSNWLSAYSEAKDILRQTRPDVLPRFEEACRIFRTPTDFSVRHLDKAFDVQMLDEIRQIVRNLQPADLELHEARNFRRFVVHNHPRFLEIQGEIAAWVSELAGEELDVSYNFLSLYSSSGVCPVHLDAPQAKWTLDVCLDQSVEWPIHFSQTLDWNSFEGKTWSDDWDQQVRSDPALTFTPKVLQPGQAILFSGSSQWHFRDPMPVVSGKRAHCDLLFFHFIPKDSAALVKPANWARLFDVPDLQSLT